MDPTMYDLHSWSKQRREEALTEALRRFEPARVGSALSGVLSLLR
jgi:hypothetical protein